MQALIVGGISSKKVKDEIPFLGTLLKKKEDIDVLMNSKKGHYAFNTSKSSRNVY